MICNKYFVNGYVSSLFLPPPLNSSSQRQSSPWRLHARTQAEGDDSLHLPQPQPRPLPCERVLGEGGKSMTWQSMRAHARERSQTALQAAAHPPPQVFLNLWRHDRQMK